MKKRMSGMQLQQALSRAKQLVMELAALDCDGIDVRLLLRQQMGVPLRSVIERIPGETLRDKAKAAGVTYQTLSGWQTGRYKITKRNAERLAKLTGYSVRQIMND